MRTTARTRDGHSSGTPVARRLQQPTRTARSDTIPKRFALAREALAPSLFGLAPGGVCRAAGVAAGAVRSYRTVSPLPRYTQRSAAVCSLWHFPWTRARRTLSGTVCPWSPDFPPRRPFGFAGAAARPTDERGMGLLAVAVKGRYLRLALRRDDEPLERYGACSHGSRPAAMGQQVLQRASGR